MACYRILRDIAELTQRVNVFESELNQLAEENEALRDRVGVGEREQVDVTPLRSRRAAELERLRETNRRLEREVGVGRGWRVGRGWCREEFGEWKGGGVGKQRKEEGEGGGG